MKQVVRKHIAEKHNIDQEKKTYTLVVDGNSLLKTSLVSYKENEDGKDYSALLTFFGIIRKILAMRDFSRCYVFWDGYNSGIMRYRIYPKYKQNREHKKFIDDSNMTDYDKKINDFCKAVLSKSRANKKEVKRSETDDERFEREKAIINQICDELFIRTYEAEEVEGDDLISFIVQNRKPNEKVTIISSDVDICQLICDDVCVYSMSKKSVISKDNFKKIFGYPHENVVLYKTLLGDSSDNIDGVGGVGEKTLFDLFPAFTEQRMTLDGIIDQAKIINEQRAKEKKKPLRSCDNIINGEKVYNINKQIIPLDKPMLTEEAESFMRDYIESPLDPTDRDLTNVYKIILENKINDLLDEKKYGDFIGAFSGLIYREKHFGQ